MPEDVAEEIAPKLLTMQRESFQLFQSRIPKIAQFHFNLSTNSTSSGTASIYQSEISSLYKNYPTETWAKDSLESFDQLANEKATKSSLLIKLGSIDANLPAFFSAAVDSYGKSKSHIVGLDNAAMRIRDLIQQLWGALVARAQQNCGTKIGKNRLALSRSADREKVSLCLANPNNKKELLLVLNQFSELWLDISGPAKDPMFSDQKSLEDFYTRTILQIDALFAWINL